jgi:uncharacterized membrane protein (DUF485 family)
LATNKGCQFSWIVVSNDAITIEHRRFIMAAFDHAPAEREAEDAAVSARNARIGWRLFLVYLAIYVTYCMLVAFRLDVMRAIGLGGVNVAVLYGFGLIIAAFVIALFYAWLCRASAGGKERP